MKLSKKVLTGLVLAALAVGVSTTALAAEVKEETVKDGNVHVMTPIVEKSKGGAAVDLAVTNDLSLNTLNALQGVVAFKHVGAPAPLTIADFAKNKPNSIESTKKNVKDLAGFVSNNLKKQEAAVKSAGKPYTVSGFYKVKDSTDNTLSVVQYFDVYTGGAHGNSTQYAGTYDLKTGKKLTLADQFEAGSNYKARLMTLIGFQSKGIARIQSNITGKKVAPIAPKTITGNEKYFIDGKDAAIVVFYNPGEIAPISEGVQEFSFGVDTIGDIMKL
jgi:hypothetical protein